VKRVKREGTVGLPAAKPEEGVGASVDSGPRRACAVGTSREPLHSFRRKPRKRLGGDGTMSDRLRALQGHIMGPSMQDEPAQQSLESNPTSAPLQEEHSYSVALPERLTPQGPWLVRRCAPACPRWWAARRAPCGSAAAHLEAQLMPVCLACLSNRHRGAPLLLLRRSALSPERLLDTFAPPLDNVRTLHDNLEAAVERFPDVSGAGGATRGGVHVCVCVCVERGHRQAACAAGLHKPLRPRRRALARRRRAPDAAAHSGSGGTASLTPTPPPPPPPLSPSPPRERSLPTWATAWSPSAAGRRVRTCGRRTRRSARCALLWAAACCTWASSRAAWSGCTASTAQVSAGPSRRRLWMGGRLRPGPLPRRAAAMAAGAGRAAAIWADRRAPARAARRAPACPHAEWVVMDAAAHAYSCVSVPLYDTLGPDTVRCEPTLHCAVPRCTFVVLRCAWLGRPALPPAPPS
jgi:hypothetical protein